MDKKGRSPKKRRVKAEDLRIAATPEQVARAVVRGGAPKRPSSKASGHYSI